MFKPNLLQLPDRESPAVLGAIDGTILFPDDTVKRPFGDYRGPINVAQTGSKWVAGAAETGGPRVSTSEGSTWFAFEPEFRGGVSVAREGDLIAVGAGETGGPVVTTYRPDGTEIARWFASDPEARYGVSVQIRNGTIYTSYGSGAGPRVDSWSPDGTLLSSVFGAPHDSRDGWELLVSDGTNDGVADLILVDNAGGVFINDGVTRGRAFTRAPSGNIGSDGQVFTFGSGYVRGRAFWNGFPGLLTYQVEDGAAGNPNPPPTTGFRPGVYRPAKLTPGTPPPNGDLGDLGLFVRAGDIVRTPGASGTAYVPMYSESGEAFVVTARHVASRDPHADVRNLPALASPGPLDFVGTAFSASDIPVSTPYSVDAVAYRTRPGVTVEPSPFRFTDAVFVPGTPLYSIGQGQFFGLGHLTQYQEPGETLAVNWGPGGIQQITGQIIASGFADLALLVPGFSGGPVWTQVFSEPEQPPIATLVGMGVAGRAPNLSVITPAPAIATSLGLLYDRKATH